MKAPSHTAAIAGMPNQSSPYPDNIVAIEAAAEMHPHSPPEEDRPTGMPSPAGVGLGWNGPTVRKYEARRLPDGCLITVDETPFGYLLTERHEKKLRFLEINGSKLILEITETEAVEYPDEKSAILGALLRGIADPRMED